MSALTQITREAKRIRRKGQSWRSAVKEASASYNRKHKSKPMKRRTTRKRRTVARKSAPRRRSSASSLSNHISKAKQLLLKKIGEKEVQKFKTRLKRGKRKVAKQIRELKSQYRKLN